MTEPGWVRIQTNTFKNWVNIHLAPLGIVVNDISKDFSNGVILIKLIEVLSGTKAPKYGANPKMRSQILDNTHIALNYLKAQGLKLVNVGAEDIADGNSKLLLGLLWIVIQKFQIIDQDDTSGKTARAALLEWVRNKIPNRNFNNFSSDWNSGDAILDLTNSLIPGSVPVEAYRYAPLQKAQLASDIAQNKMKIPPLLSPEDLIDSNVDEQSVMTYLSLFKEWNKAEVSTSLTEVELRAGDNIHIKTIDKNGDVVVYGGHEFKVTTSYSAEVTEAVEESAAPSQGATTSHTFYWDHGGDNGGVGGTFNDWAVEPMEKDSEGNYSLTIDGFDATVLHHFKYNIDGEWKVDPEQPVDDSGKVNGRTVVYNAIIPKGTAAAKAPAGATTTKVKTVVKEWPVEDNGDGTFRSHFERSPTAGEPTIVIVAYQGKEIKRYVIEDERAESATVKVEDESHLHIKALDGGKKQMLNGGDDFTAFYESNGNKSPITITDHKNGTYSGRFDRDTDYEGQVTVFLRRDSVFSQNLPAKKRMASDVNSKVTVKGNGLLIQAMDNNNKACIADGCGVFTAEYTQEGKKVPIDLKERNGKFEATLNHDPDFDAVVSVFLNGKKIHTETLQATSKRSADAKESQAKIVNQSKVEIKAIDSKGRPLTEGGDNFIAELVQNGKTSNILLKDLNNGSYEGDFEVKPEYDAVVNVYHNGQTVLTENIKATKPGADANNTAVAVADGKVTIKAKTKDGSPAKHSDGHFTAKLEQSGSEIEIPLVNYGDGTYSGTFNVPNPKKDCIVRVFHDGAHVGDSPYVIPRLPAKVSAIRSTAKLEGDKVEILAYDDDGDAMTGGGDKFRVEVLQEGKKTVVPVRDNKDGTYISSSLPLVPTEDAVIEVTYERQPIYGTPFNIKAVLVKADKVTTFVTVEDGLLTIEPKDSQGFPAPGFHNAFKATVEQDGEEKEISLKEGRDGKFTGEYEVDQYSPAKVNVFLHGEHVGSSPFTLQGKEKPKEAPKAVDGKVVLGEGGKITIQAVDKNGNNVTTGGAPFTADVSQSGKMKKIALKDNGDGTYTGQYEVDPEKDALILVDLDGKKVHRSETKATLSKAYGPNTKVKTDNNNYVFIESFDQKGREVKTGDAAFTAELIQRGKSKPIIIEDHEDGTYDGKYDRDPDYDAVLNVYHDGKKVHTENIKATKRNIHAPNTAVTSKDGEINIKTYDANKKPLIHGGNNFTAELVQNGKKVAVPLTDNRDGSYKGKYEQDPFHDGQVNIYHEGVKIHTENLKKQKSKPVDPLKCIVKVNGGDINIEARDKDGQRINEGGHNFGASVTRGPATEKIVLKDHGDGRYTGKFVENNEVESILDFTQDGNPVCTYRIKPVGVKEVPVPQLHPEDVGEVQVFQTQVSIGEKQLSISTFDADGLPINLVRPIVDPNTKAVRQEQFKAFYQGPGVRVNIELIPKETGILVSEDYRLKYVGEYKFHVFYGKTPLQGSPYVYNLVGDLSIEAEETTRTLDMSKPAWQRYGDNYVKYNGAPPKHLLVYFPDLSDLHFYQMPMGLSSELEENVVKLNAQSTGLTVNLQRVVPTTSDAILFYNAKTGEVQSAKVNEERQLSPLKLMKETKPSKKWKHIVPIDVNGQHAVLFYEKGTGRAQIRQVTAHGELVVRSESNDWAKNWDKIAPVQVADKTSLFLYDSAKKKVDIALIDSSCNLNVTGTAINVSEKWKHVVGLTPGFVLFLEKKSGSGQINRVDAKGTKKLRSFKTDKNVWTHVEFIAHNRQVVFYSKKTGLAQFWDWEHRDGTLKLAFTKEWKGAKFVSASY